VTTYYGSSGVARLAQDLARVPRELRPRVRAALTTSGGELRQLAAQNASWSRRIPDALKVRTRFSGTRAGVYVVASRLTAPGARPLEGITGNATFRHPVLGHGNEWVDQDTRPYLAPAVEAEADQAVGRLQDAMDQALRVAGFG